MTLTANHSRTTVRQATPQHYLMCRPTHFDVTYEINAWMDTEIAVDTSLAQRQWDELYRAYQGLGHTIELVEGIPGQPDMVFTANAGTVLDGVAVAARFRNAQRTGEEPGFADWFRRNCQKLIIPEYVNEGEGDFLWTGSVLLGASGYRSDPRSGRELSAIFQVELVELELVDEHFYHLDTALAVLATDEIAYLPAAFSAKSQALLAARFPNAILVDAGDADWFGLNAASDGHNVVVAAQAVGFHQQLAARGFRPVPIDVSEFRKSGGGIKCCTLNLGATSA